MRDNAGMTHHVHHAIQLLAQADAGTDLVTWVQYGAAGLVVIAIITGLLVPGHAYKREAERADRLEEENDRLRTHNEERVVPLLERAMDVINRSSSPPYHGQTHDRDRH